MLSLRIKLKRSSYEVHGVSPEAGRESMVGKICERRRLLAGSKNEEVMDDRVDMQSEMW